MRVHPIYGPARRRWEIVASVSLWTCVASLVLAVALTPFAGGAVWPLLIVAGVAMFTHVRALFRIEALRRRPR